MPKHYIKKLQPEEPQRDWNKQLNPMSNYLKGNFAGIQGAGNEQLVAARALKHGFIAFFKLWSDTKYDMVLECENELFRVQIKGTATGLIACTTRQRGGVQQPNKKPVRFYTRDDCDLLIGVDSNTGDCYVIPIDYVIALGKSGIKIKESQVFRERWDYIIGNRFLTPHGNKVGLSSSELQNNLKQILPEGTPIPSDLNHLRILFYEKCPRH